MADVTYPPLDTLKPVAEDVWIVDSGPLKLMGVPIPIRMTVIRLASGALLLHSPTPFRFPLKAELEAIGRVEHLMAPNVAHWSFLKEWQAHFPDAAGWTVPGLQQRPAVASANLRIDGEVGDTPPAAWNDEIETVLVAGAGLAETGVFHRASRTLVLTDLVVNLEPQKLPPLMRTGVRLLGSAAPDGKAPVYARLAIGARREATAAAARRLVDLAPERVIFAHGAYYAADGAARLRKALDWLIG